MFKLTNLSLMFIIWKNDLRPMTTPTDTTEVSVKFLIVSHNNSNLISHKIFKRPLTGSPIFLGYGAYICLLDNFTFYPKFGFKN